MSLFSKYPYTNFSDYNLDWCINTVKQLWEAVNGLNDWKETHTAEYEELRIFYNALNSGNFPNSFRVALYNWMMVNAKDIVGAMVQNVYFGLTNDGYFVAYIPDSWKDVIFRTTGLDYETDLQGDFGHLVLLM